MPQKVHWFIRTSAVYFVLTFLLGAIFLYHNWLVGPMPRPWVIAHLHAGLVGWLVDIVIGVGLGRFALNREEFPKGGGRYPPALAHFCYLGLNIKRRVRRVAALLFCQTGNHLMGGLMALAGIPQVAAAAIFLYVVWKRVRQVSGLKANP